MKYEQIKPPDQLQGHIKYYWTMESSVDSVTNTFRTIADGCPGLIFQQTENGDFYQNNKKLPGIFLYGQATRHAELYMAGRSTTVGIFFYPHALKSIFGLNADELTDSCIDMELITSSQNFQLSQQLMNTSSTNDRIKILSSYLFCQIRNDKRQPDGTIEFALSLILKSEGNIPLKELQENIQLSERSFERRFKQSIGISPKLFSRICRFQASLNQLRKNKYNKLSDIAFENEYADQSHFIRTFKEFAGFSPFQYQKQSKEIVENLLNV
ncbi:MAG: AraC family transcriptional regulator [Chitinophagaceae bacterium]|nr:AraC family transcriptional regulator [Chitinophagaceae bacterium]